MGDIEVLHEEILYESGPYRRTRRYLKGKHPELGVLHQGWTGWETIQEIDVFQPKHIYYVVDPKTELAEWSALEPLEWSESARAQFDGHCQTSPSQEFDSIPSPVGDEPVAANDHEIWRP